MKMHINLKPLPHEQVFLDKVSLDNFSLLVWKGKFGNFFLDKCHCSKTGVREFYSIEIMFPADFKII